MAGLVGYSMGGYGVVNVIGGGYSQASETLSRAPPNRLLADRGTSNPGFQKSLDSRIKAAIAIGPWGMQGGFWDADGLKGIRTPVLFVAGSMDDVSGYENAAAPMPAPLETCGEPVAPRSAPFMHYADAVWDTTRMNNILQHFATAYFNVYLKGADDHRAYFDGSWKGFKPRTAVGLTLEHALPATRQ